MIRLPHLETDVTQACQLSCVGCNHAVPLWRKHGPWTATPEQVHADLSALARIAHASTWAALGGEPLLNKQIVRILDVAKESGIADEYELWTNGLRLLDAPFGLWDVVDRVVISRYPGKLADEFIARVYEVADHFDVHLVVRDEINEPNFMTWLEKEPTDATTTFRKYQQCAFRRGNNYAASYGFFFACCCGPHIPLLVQSREFGDDGVRLEGLTEQALRNYLTRVEPFGACAVCAGRDTATKIPWREERDPLTWLHKSAGKDGVTR